MFLNLINVNTKDLPL